MRLSKREIELTKASELGKKAASSYDTKCPDFNGDKSLQDAWKNGYSIQSKENDFWHSKGYY